MTMSNETTRSLDAALMLARELALELVLKCGCPDHQAQVDMFDIELRALRRQQGPFTEPVAGADLDGEERLTDALAPFGWTMGPEFWRRYYSDPWVFNLANAVEKLTMALGARNTEAELIWIEENERLRTSLSRLSIPGNACGHCGAIMNESIVCPGCGWADPLTKSVPKREKDGKQ